MIVEQLDVTTAYLNGKLDEEFYMEVPNHIMGGLKIIAETKLNSESLRKKASNMIRDLDSKDEVCRLNKAIYELRQAGRC